MSSYTLIIAGGIFFYLLTCFAFVDIARKDFGSIFKKAMWGFLVFIPFFGVLFYLLLGFKSGKKSDLGE